MDHFLFVDNIVDFAQISAFSTEPHSQSARALQLSTAGEGKRQNTKTRDSRRIEKETERDLNPSFQVFNDVCRLKNKKEEPQDEKKWG